MGWNRPARRRWLKRHGQPKLEPAIDLASNRYVCAYCQEPLSSYGPCPCVEKRQSAGELTKFLLYGTKPKAMA